MKKTIYIILCIIIFTLSILIIFPKKETYASTENSLSNGIYIIKSGIDENYVLDVTGGSKISGANVQLYKDSDLERTKI